MLHQPKSMRRAVAAASACGSLFLAGSAVADEELFKKSNCLACHAIDQKRLGPSMKDVAAKYSGDSGAADMLARKIREGGVGVWGQLPMPPQPQVSEADAKVLAEFILSVR
ncbi:c-type cytochrome [Ramlibacter sp. Leaf400]|uniref:c-type cytochrome n=1 Tax=Ramlibacter sp. Leaf400 TaxID=1736365 RepID=UPI001F18CB93|nr:c-type cytochrome [Ramlibacter sp. Leaf400]